MAQAANEQCMTWNVMATIRHQEIAGYTKDGQAIYERQDYDRVFLEGFETHEEAQRYAGTSVRSNVGVVVEAWIQVSGELPDRSKAVK